MTKPICVIYIPDDLDLGNGRVIAPSELMRILNGWDKEKYRTDDYWADYLWFSFFKSDIDAPEFQVFNGENLTEIQYEELKQLILNSIEK